MIGSLPSKIVKYLGKLDTKQLYHLAIINTLCIILVLLNAFPPVSVLLTPFVTSSTLQPLKNGKTGYEVLGFAPYWTFDKLTNIDFNTLTTLSFFGIPVMADGSLDTSDKGYQVFQSPQATRLFTTAHNAGTRVVLTITQMDNQTIKDFLDDPQSHQQAIDQVTQEVKNRGIDGVNVDFEYAGNPGKQYRRKFNNFVQNLTNQMHQEIPSSQVTVSVYASSTIQPKIYDIPALSKSADGIFMMAYDFAVTSSDHAIPTAPLYGHKQGQYWYDISSAVEDFLKVMPADKLILGVPYYGYNYLVYQPTVKATTRPFYSWRGKPTAQTYTAATDHINPNMEGIDDFQTGWDDLGQVGYKAYHVADTDTWRIVFLDDAKSLALKYDFAKSKALAGVGIWALGFDDGKTELWNLLAEKFGAKLTDSGITNRKISNQ